MEGGSGTSDMNTYVETVSVQEGYPKKSEDPDNCDHDESLNPSGENRCSTNDDCQGNRWCSEWGWCHGDSGCKEEDKDDETKPDPQPDNMCLIDEMFNEMGPNRCNTDNECKGDRICCTEMNYCVAYSNCEDDKDWEKELKCMINEAKNPLGDKKCSRSDECKGDRTCSEDGFCKGKSNCKDDELTPEQKC